MGIGERVGAMEAESAAAQGSSVFEGPEVPFFERIMGGVMGKMKSKALPA